jgi:glycosyltransferase involved in cell wall biosynthesis
MACGCACVLTSVGGVNEYARHGENALLVPPRHPDLAAHAVARLVGDSALRRRLVEGGLRTARAYCHRREARETLDLFRQFVSSVGSATIESAGAGRAAEPGTIS